ncbi:MAG: hypothetical protein SFV22_16815 [Saprospiraceae bacterium]|nr:hypothetical protein [Saprospiraceae bacterium]
MNTRLSNPGTIVQIGGLMFNLMECANAPSLPQVLLFALQMLLSGRRAGNGLMKLKALLLLAAALGRAADQALRCSLRGITGLKFFRYFIAPPDLAG